MVDHSIVLPKMMSGVYLQCDYWMKQIANLKNASYTSMLYQDWIIEIC